MATIKNSKDLNKYLTDLLIKAMDKVGERALKHMFDFVDEQMQRRVSDQKGFYDRTYEYLKSISRTKATLVYGEVVVSVGYNTDNPSNLIRIDETDHKIFPYIQGVNPPFESEQQWNWHADFWGETVSNLIPLFLEYGTDNRFYSHEPVGAIVNLEEWVILNLRNELKKELTKLGLKIK